MNKASANDFPFKKKKIRVENSFMHYIDEGSGEPVLFLHGNPTSSYIWRHMIARMKKQARCIAPDLIGMGSSGKPNLPYRFDDHYRYLQAFIQAKELRNITLVLHDWGSALGFRYAMDHPENTRGMAFMEAMIRPWQWSRMYWYHRWGFRLLRAPVVGEIMIYGFNAFLNVIMPRLIIRKLTPEEWAIYKRPFRKISHRKPMLVWPREIPISGHPQSTDRIFKAYEKFLQESQLPKLLIYAKPGAITDHETVGWCRQNIPNLTTVFAGTGLHYLQEDHPAAIGEEIARWHLGLKQG
jgi:haloalkane dehalogenase